MATALDVDADLQYTLAVESAVAFASGVGAGPPEKPLSRRGSN